MDRFMFGMRLQFEGRMTNPGSGQPTGTQADAPYSLLENIAIEGYHRPRKQKEKFYDCRGADLRELNRIYSIHAPVSTPSSLSVTASATNDIRFSIELPFVPYNVPLSEQVGWLLDCPNYDALQLTIRWADALSVFTGQTTQPTFTAYGATTGSAKIRVIGLFALDGMNKFARFVPGRVFRTFQEVVSGDIINGATNSRLFAPPKGYRVRGMLLKSGVKSATVTGGNNAYLTLSNSILTNQKVNVGQNRSIRYYTDTISMQEQTANAYGLAPNTGFSLIDFCQRGTLKEALMTGGLVAGATGDVDFTVNADISGAAAQAALLLTEELRNAPKFV